MKGLKIIRKEKNLNQQKVAIDLNISREALSHYENGKREPSVDILLKLSKLYGVSVDYLIGNDEIVDTSISKEEGIFVKALRHADERAAKDALALLELHQIEDK